jgi:cell division transport system permease protein
MTNADQDADIEPEEDQPHQAGSSTSKSSKAKSRFARWAQMFAQSRLPLIPAETTASRALVTVIAIMTFLATLTGGGAVLVYDASKGWDSSISQEMTIQVKPVLGRDVEADVRKSAELARSMPGFSEIRAFSHDESTKLLEPWLGAGLDLSGLPIPRLIVLKLAGSPRPNLEELRRQLRQQVPSAVLDDHRLWLERLGTMSRALVLIALVVLGLVLTAMALAVAFATQGAMAGSREIVDVLHFVGAEDRFIANEFQRHFLKLGLKGGLIGGGAALIVFFLAGVVTSWWVTSLEGNQVEALFGNFSLGSAGYVTIIMITCGIAALTALMSRSVVLRRLRRIN